MKRKERFLFFMEELQTQHNQNLDKIDVIKISHITTLLAKSEAKIRTNLLKFSFNLKFLLMTHKLFNSTSTVLLSRKLGREFHLVFG